MINKKLKKGLKIAGMVIALLIIVLVIHIYYVTHPKADASTISMARIDFKQTLSSSDAMKLTSWLYQQKGVDHVLYNPSSNIAIFSFYNLNANANNIVNQLNSNLHLNAIRFMPTANQMKSGCPVLSQSITGRIYQFFKHI